MPFRDFNSRGATSSPPISRGDYKGRPTLSRPRPGLSASAQPGLGGVMPKPSPGIQGEANQAIAPQSPGSTIGNPWGSDEQKPGSQAPNPGGVMPQSSAPLRTAGGLTSGSTLALRQAAGIRDPLGRDDRARVNAARQYGGGQQFGGSGSALNIPGGGPREEQYGGWQGARQTPMQGAGGGVSMRPPNNQMDPVYQSQPWGAAAGRPMSYNGPKGNVTMVAPDSGVNQAPGGGQPGADNNWGGVGYSAYQMYLQNQGNQGGASGAPMQPSGGPTMINKPGAGPPRGSNGPQPRPMPPGNGGQDFGGSWGPAMPAWGNDGKGNWGPPGGGQAPPPQGQIPSYMDQLGNWGGSLPNDPYGMARPGGVRADQLPQGMQDQFAGLMGGGMGQLAAQFGGARPTWAPPMQVGGGFGMGTQMPYPRMPPGGYQR